MNKNEIIKSSLAGFYSCITIGILTLLTYKTDLGVFLIASFGSSMVVLYGYPESPFAQPKNVFFWTCVDICRGNVFFVFCAYSTLYSFAYCGRSRSCFNDFA